MRQIVGTSHDPSTPHGNLLRRVRRLPALLVLAVALLTGCQAALQGAAPESRPESGLLLVSDSADLSDPRPLAGETLSGEVYLFLRAREGLRDVRIAVDGQDPVALGVTPASLERWDGVFAARRTKDDSHPWNTKKLPNGRNKVQVEEDVTGDDGTVQTETSEVEFDVDNPPEEPVAEGPVADRLLFGAWTSGGPWYGMNDTYYELERKLGFQLDVVHWYMSFSTPWLGHLVESASEGGRSPMITWEAHVESLDDIAAGVYDDRLRDWGRGAAAYGEVLYMRPFQEMNADFFPWGMDPEGFVAAWRRIVDVFRSEGADNVRWVWAPNADDNPNTAENKMENYYPGGAYVDVLAIDGYNWGTCRSWARWQSFDQVMADAYDRVTALGDQPVWIAEFGSTELGGDKAQWIRDAFASTAFPRVEALIYFDEDTGNGCDWDIGTSDASLQAFAEALAGLDSGAALLAAHTR